MIIVRFSIATHEYVRRGRACKKKDPQEEHAMDGLIFLVVWLGGATLHTLYELHWRSGGSSAGEAPSGGRR